MWTSFAKASLQRRYRDRAAKSHGRGFSHPMAVETLEQRLPLSVDSAGGSASAPGGAPNGAPGAIAPSPFGEGQSFGGGAAAGLETTPAGTTGIGTTGIGTIETGTQGAQSELAFNNPSWIPQDRPPAPITSQPGDHLPFNPYQTVETPYGVRNFTIGPNTSMSHGAASPLPREPRSARAETESQSASFILGEDILGDEWALRTPDKTIDENLLDAAASDFAAASLLPSAPRVGGPAVDTLMAEEIGVDEATSAADYLTAGGESESTPEIAAQQAKTALQQMPVEQDDAGPRDAGETAHAAVATSALLIGLAPMRQPARAWQVEDGWAARQRRRLERLGRSW